jgi:hypothetical protein
MSELEKERGIEIKGGDYDFAIVDEYEAVVDVGTKGHVDQGDSQKIYYGFVYLEENLEDSVVEVIEKLKDFVVVGKPLRGFELDSVELLPENRTHSTQEPLWVTKQKGKQFKRGKK